ncbi:hypothetical protein AGMMS50255_0640 [Spirochaetia bacterium]|nr:hypothetical protein AGMMS50255_0640 [Spirochaetia bacterium]
MSSYPYSESSAYLRHIVNTFAKEERGGGFPVRDVFLEWPKLELEKRHEGSRPLNQTGLEKSLNMINTRVDCADFVLPAFLSMLYLYKDSALLSNENRELFKQAILGYKYAMDDPNEDKNGVCYFTENHQALFASCELIAGQLFPDETFTNNKQKGSWHRDRGEKRMRQWIDWRARLGYSEWLSNGYYSEDLLALAIVYGLSEKEDLRKDAGKLIEVTLFDVAVNSFDGLMGASNGRAYVSPTLRPELGGTSSIAKLFWGEGSYEAVSLGTVALAVFDYRCSAAVKNVGRDKSAIINRERMSINVEDSKKFGLDPKKYDDIMFYWGQQTFLHRDVIENSMKLCPKWLGMRPSIDAHWEKYQILEKAGFKPEVIEPLLSNGLIEGKAYDPDYACCALTQTDIYTYRTPYYLLSNSQDFRKAKVGYQQHIWQATLGGRALVFTNCPGSEEYRDRPNRFAGNSFMPRTVQHKNVLLCVYRTPTESAHFFFTHLYFPQREFDEVREENGWIFGKRGGAYIAVYSSIPGKWQRPDPELYKSLFPRDWEEEFKLVKPYDYNVPKHAVVYVCEMGDEKNNGSFEQFTGSFKNAAFSGDTFAFNYASPSAGTLSFGWNESLKINGEEIPIHGYKRYDNPYCQTEFGEKSYHIRCGGEEVKLEF